MGKKKKKKKKDDELDVLMKFDETLDRKYVDLIEEIQFMQADLRREERKAKKKQEKKLKKGGAFYSTAGVEFRVRQELINKIEGTNFLDRVLQTINDLVPVCAIIGKMVMALIVGILSVDSIKYTIKPETLNSMHKVYNVARQVSARI